jgi:hypothetical protein
MPRNNSDDGRWQDMFHPPRNATQVHCIKCNRDYMSNEMKWEKSEYGEYFWFCKYDDCPGRGFGFHIFKALSQEVKK